MVTQLYSDGTGHGSKDITGLKAAIAATGIYGGINRDTHAWWRAKSVSNNTVGVPEDLSLAKMMSLFLAISDGNDRPDLILCGQGTWYEYYKLVETATQLTTPMGQQMASYGFQTLEFMGVPVVADPSCDEGLMYFLNSKYMKWRPHKQANFATTPFHTDDTRLAKKQEILLTTQLTINNCRRFGVLTDISYTAIP